MVRIAHISDSHLGSSLFELPERREDVRKCFKKAIDMAVKHSPDMIVHTGDLYHNPLPSVEDQNFVIKVFKSLKDKIPLYVVQGNHDQPYGFRYTHSTLRGLETMELIKSTGDSHYASFTDTFDGKRVEIHLVSWCPESRVQRLINTVTPKEEIALFFAHDISVRRTELPIHFNYYGCGHKHAFLLDKDYDFGRPGSTCVVNWSRELQSSQKIIIVDIDSQGNEYTVQTLNDVREFKLIQGVDITGMGPDEASLTMKRRLDGVSPKKEKPIIIMQVNGIIDSETERGILRSDVIKYGEKKHNPLFLYIEPNWECAGASDLKMSEPLNVQSSIREYMEHSADPMMGQVIQYLPEFIGGDVS
ncbi:MAG: metallophosphoesterase family protein [Candidatus Thorarchaeota archaeon]